VVLSFDGRVVATSRRSGSRSDVAPWRFVSGLLRSRHDSEAGRDINISGYDDVLEPRAASVLGQPEISASCW